MSQSTTAAGTPAGDPATAEPGPAQPSLVAEDVPTPAEVSGALEALLLVAEEPRRTGDLASLMPAWGRAREAIVRHPVDLFVLQQLGELSIAATRLREPSWVRPHLDEAAQLLARLGDPALWAAPLHWSVRWVLCPLPTWARTSPSASRATALRLISRARGLRTRLRRSGPQR